MFPAYYSFEETNIENIFSLVFWVALSLYIIISTSFSTEPLFKRAPWLYKRLDFFWAPCQFLMTSILLWHRTQWTELNWKVFKVFVICLNKNTFYSNKTYILQKLKTNEKLHKSRTKPLKIPYTIF